MMRGLDFYSHKNGVKSFGQTVRLFIRAVYGAAQQLAATFCQKCGNQGCSPIVCAGSRDRRLIGWVARKTPKTGISGNVPRSYAAGPANSSFSLFFARLGNKQGLLGLMYSEGCWLWA